MGTDFPSVIPKLSRFLRILVLNTHFYMLLNNEDCKNFHFSFITFHSVPLKGSSLNGHFQD